MAKQWYDKNIFLNILWTITGIVWVPIYLVWSLVTRDFSKDSKPKWLRWWGNRVDNLWDQLIQWLHCHKIPYTNKQLNLSFIMGNRTTTWDIIREHKKWPNCDPEDFPEPHESK